MIERDWRIAVHESGHAVVGRVLFDTCGAASIIEPAGAECPLPSNHGAASVVALMAGVASEIVLLGDYDMAGLRGDAEMIDERVRWYGFDRDWLWQITVDVVQQQQHRIARVAHKLRRARVLDGATIDRLVCG
jgi:hypothetical protein